MHLGYGRERDADGRRREACSRGPDAMWRSVAFRDAHGRVVGSQREADGKRTDAGGRRGTPRDAKGRHEGRRGTCTDAEWDAYGRVLGRVRTQCCRAEDAFEHKVYHLRRQRLYQKSRQHSPLAL